MIEQQGQVLLHLDSTAPRKLRLAPRHRFFADVYHANPAAAVEMGERAASCVVGRFSDWLLAWHRGRRLRAYVDAMRRYNKALQWER